MKPTQSDAFKAVADSFRNIVRFIESAKDAKFTPITELKPRLVGKK